jgi:transmembrane sensor
MSNIDDEALDWVMRQAGGQLGGQDRAAFDAWFAASPRHQGAYLRARAIQHSLDQVSVQDNLKPPAQTRDTGWEGKPPHPARNRRAFMFGGALAAGIAALAAVSLRPRLLAPTVLQTARGEFRKVPLADRSNVSMNSGTELEVAMGGAERRIVLKQGEAWFEVAKDKTRPFIVESGGVRVRAVGTAFSVRRQPAGAQVLVTEGVVEVWSQDGTAPVTRMTAGAQALVLDAAAEIAVSQNPDDVERKLAWRSGKLVLQNQTLEDAVLEFNRYNARQILIADPALRRKILVGQYRIDQPDYFANDVRTLFRVPVAVGADRITIGAGAAGAGR